MPVVFHFHHTAEEQEIDGLGHVNNIAYIHWLQSAAVAHSAAQGWQTADYKQHGWSWVVRKHSIEYRRPVLLGEEIVVKTWVADMKKYSSLRKYQIIHKESGKLIARAETNWAFIELESGKLIAVPEQVSRAFQVIDSPEAADA